MSILQKFALSFVACMMITLIVSPLSAHSIPTHTPAALDQEMLDADNLKIKIIIIIIIKKKKKGIAEIVGMRLAKEGAAAKSLCNNEVVTEAWTDGNKFIMNYKCGTYKEGFIIFPDQFKVSKEVSLKLGHKEQILLGKGRMKAGPNSLGNFEIQD